jgi:hypothetical protein
MIKEKSLQENHMKAFLKKNIKCYLQLTISVNIDDLLQLFR